MAHSQRAAIAIALLALACAVSPVVADTDTMTMASGSVGMVSGLGTLAVRALSRMSEPGALLILGTGLAAASLALSRKQHQGK